MAAVIAISSWHVGNYMSTFDGWLMAAIMGATLGSCNFLCAHNIFKAGSTSRFPSFVGLIFFAITSTWMQYTYFNENPEISVTLFHGVNLNALALGIWAPVAEIVLGWVYAANHKTELPERMNASSPLRDLTQAVTRRIEQGMLVRPSSEQLGSTESPMNTGVVQPSPYTFKGVEHTNGDAVQVNNAVSASDVSLNGETAKPSKAEAMNQLLTIFATDPHATYEQAGAAIGRSKSTVSNYVQELKQAGRVEVSDEGGVQVIGE